MMIGIGMPSSQSKIPRPTGTSSFVSCKDLTRRTPLGQNSCIAPEADVDEAGNCVPASRPWGLIQTRCRRQDFMLCNHGYGVRGHPPCGIRIVGLAHSAAEK